MKKKSRIVIENDMSMVICGIYYDPKNDPKIIFYVKKYFDDFKHGFKTYYDQLQNDDSGILLEKLNNALKSVDSGLNGVLGDPGSYSGTSGSTSNIIIRSRSNSNSNALI